MVDSNNSDDSMLTRAINLAAAGFFTFPLVENSKVPAIKDYATLATRDPAQIRAWWTRWPRANIGISTTHNLLAVDVDVADGKRGDQSVLELELEGYDLPATREQTTPTGGRHWIYSVPEPVSQGTDVLGPGVDTRASGGYLVGAGSVIDGKRYTIDDTPIAPAPQWLIDRCGRAPERQEQAPPPENIDTDRAYERARYYLLQECPAATAGSRNDSGYKAACKLNDFGVDRNTCLQLMLELWPCEPALDPDEVEHVVRSAYSYGQQPQGASAPEAHFTPIGEGPAANEEDGAPKPSRFAIKSGRALQIDYSKRRDLIKDVVPEHGVSMVVGAPKSRKSFLALDMALHVALGRDWHGHRVKPGAVAYIAAEAPESIQMRFDAWCRRHDTDMDSVRFGVISDAPNLRMHDDTRDLIAAVRDFSDAPALIVVDTLNQAFGGGDENSASDAGVFIRRCQEIHRHTGAHVLLVHHTGVRNTNRGRGSTAFSGGVDSTLVVYKKPHFSIVHRTEVKDGQEGNVLTFALDSVALGADAEGDMLHSAVLRPTRPAAADMFTPQPQPKGQQAQIALAKLQEIVSKKPDDDPSPWVPDEAWRQACVGEISPGSSIDTDSRAFRRACKKLLQEKFIEVRDGQVRLENFAPSEDDDDE